MLDIVPIPAFRDNYIWAICRGDLVAVVDPGDDEPVRRFLVGKRLAAILITHHHQDHVGGVAALLRAFPENIPVYGPGAESITGVTEPLAGGEQITVPGVEAVFDVLAVPGHTRGHIAYFGEGALFCGDTLFGAGCGRLFEGTPEQMHRSLAQFDRLPGRTQVYCAHEYTLQNLRFAVRVEPENADIAARVEQCTVAREQGIPTVPSTLDDERRTNPFLRSDAPAVVRAAHARGAGATPVEVFAAIRAWRDEF